jgi:hypothetical protein
MRLAAEKLLEALARPFAERVRDLEELSARHEVEADAEGVGESPDHHDGGVVPRNQKCVGGNTSRE